MGLTHITATIRDLAGKNRVTCFFLGWVAERFPHLVREARARGHEIASHGYSHRLVYKMTPGEFLDVVEFLASLKSGGK